MAASSDIKLAYADYEGGRIYGDCDITMTHLLLEC